jgi:probable HAF family extracellular repeat protein
MFPNTVRRRMHRQTRLPLERKNNIRKLCLESLEARRLLASFQGLGDLPGGSIDSLAFGVSADGQVVVGRSIGENGQQMPFRWTAQNGMTSIGFLPGDGGGTAYKVSADGNVIVGFSGGMPSGLGGYALHRSFRWEQGVMIEIATPNTIGGYTGVSVGERRHHWSWQIEWWDRK